MKRDSLVFVLCLVAATICMAQPETIDHWETAVFFDDLPDLEAKLAHYLAHEDEAAAIAARGRALLLERHTSSARARQLLGRMAEVLGEGR